MVGCLVAKAEGLSDMNGIDLLAAGDELKALIQPLVGQDLREVLIATDMAEVKNISQVAPAVAIIYQGDRVDSSSQSGLVSSVVQSWLVLLVHRFTPGQARAGVMLGRVLSACAGKPFSNSTFKRVSPGVRPSYAAGVSYLPLAFEITIKFKGVRS